MSDRNPYRAPGEENRQPPGLVSPRVRTMSIASILAVFGTVLVVGVVARLANALGVDTGSQTVRSTLSVVAGAVLGVVLGVVALRRSSAYRRSVVRTQSIIGIVVNVLFLVWVL